MVVAGTPESCSGNCFSMEVTVCFCVCMCVCVFSDQKVILYHGMLIYNMFEFNNISYYNIIAKIKITKIE